MRVEIWSDVACPFCYIGKRSFEEAFRQFDNAEGTEVIWRSFQLGPGMPKEVKGDIYDVLAAKYGGTREQAIAMNLRVATLAEQVGLDCDFDSIKPTNTGDAHRLIHLATEAGRSDEAKEFLFEAYFRDGLNVSDHDVLRGIAQKLALDPAEVDDLLAGDRFASEVEHDQEQAHDLGIGAVPTFVFDRSSAVPGAQSTELLLDALNTAWSMREST
ncbi:MAG: DsbA family oxidoreductase [Actinomycetes bacterium]